MAAPIARFEAATAHVKHLPSTPTNADLLRLYALFKQATKGDCVGDRPGAFSVAARAKWDAWHGITGMATGDAQERYVAVVRELDPAWSPPPHEEGALSNETNEDADANEKSGYNPTHLPQRRDLPSPHRRRVQSSFGRETPSRHIITTTAKAVGPSSHQRGATWSPNMASASALPSTPLTPTFVRSMKNNDHTAYLISVSYSRILSTLAGAAATPKPTADLAESHRRISSAQSNLSDDILESAEAYFDDGNGDGKNEDVEWHITARYSDFVRLHSDLLSRGGFREDDLPSLPPKKWLFNQDPNFVQKRMDELQQYTSLLLLDPRIARNEIVTSFFKVAENMMMLRAAKGMPQYGEATTDTTTRGRTTTSPTATSLQSDRSSDSSSSNMMSSAEASETAFAATRSFDSPQPPKPTERLPESVSETEQIVPVELVALDADDNVLHAANIKFWKRENFLTLPWVHRNSNLELRFRGGMYAPFMATDKTSRGERTLQLMRRRQDGDSAQNSDSSEMPSQLGQITLRVRLRTSRVKGGLLSSPQASPNNKHQRGLNNDTEKPLEKPLLQQVLLLSLGFIFAGVLSWLAFRYEAPLATTMSLPLLPIALVLGWVFGDSPKNLSDASYKQERKTSEMFLNVGIKVTSYVPAKDEEDSSGGTSGQTDRGVASKNLPRFIDMTGVWIVDYALSKTTIEPMTKALGVGWVARKAINALTFTTVIKHTPEHFERFDKLKGNRVGKEQPPYKLDGKPCKVEDDNGFVDVRCWSEPAEAMVTVETTIPETSKNTGALLTDTLTLEHNGEWLHQRIKVVTKGSSEPVFVDRILKRVEGKPVEGPGLWA